MIRSLVIALALVILPITASAAAVPMLKSGAADPAIDPSQFASLLVVDIPSGKTLYQYNATSSWVPASLTKLMVVEEYTRTSRNWSALGNILSSDEVGGGRLAVVAGSTLTLRDLLCVHRPHE
jgi:D-alanyl-D-alanine carboxypeptidase